MSSAIPSSHSVALPCDGKGTFIQWTDMSPSRLAQSPLSFASALTASVSLSMAPWCSTPKLCDMPHSHRIQSSLSSDGDALSSPADKLDFLRNKMYTGDEATSDTCTSPLARAVSAVASLGLMSWRTSRVTKRTTLLESHVEAREAHPISSKVTTSTQSSAMAVPSVGSLSHNTGSCKPCAWFWKPKGCTNGAECNHCHVCPADELQRRRKTKTAQIKLMENTNPDEGVFCTDICSIKNEQVDVYIDDLCPVEQDTVARAPVGIAVPRQNCEDLCQSMEMVGTNANLASVGSQLHSSGQCRPCSWFWKPQGCQFGAECLHCHVCLDGEQKRRKKSKVMALRAAGVPKTKRPDVGRVIPHL